LLLACTIVALAWANSPWAESYFALSHKYIAISWGNSSFELSLQHWINDLLMAVFFFVVGLEIKREIVVGQLSSFEKSILPVSAALGGMVVPAIMYAVLNMGGEGTRGWGIPMATDIGGMPWFDRDRKSRRRTAVRSVRHSRGRRVAGRIHLGCPRYGRRDHGRHAGPGAGAHRSV
jgi:hypothetical protein